jgi:hypothetical protein
MARYPSTNTARIHTLIPDNWGPLENSVALGLHIDTAESVLQADNDEPGVILSGAQAALGRLAYAPFSAARTAAVQWWKEVGTPFNRVANPILERATRASHGADLPADAVLYRNGLPYTLIVFGTTEEEACEAAEVMAATAAAWVLFVPFVVAATANECWVREPGSPHHPWPPLAAHELQWLLEPTHLARVVEDGLQGVLEAHDGPLSQLSPIAEEALWHALARAREQQDGLLSVAEGPSSDALVAALCRDLVKQVPVVVLAVAHLEMRERLHQILIECCDPGAFRRNLPPGIHLRVLSSLSHDCAAMGPTLDKQMVVVAYGVDEGFGSDRGFQLRLTFPRAPWISITRLPPDGIPASVRHAFGNPLDSEGVLAIVDDTRGRVPVDEVRLDHGPVPPEALDAIALNLVLKFSHFGEGVGNTLVLVPDNRAAAALVESFKAPAHAILDATQHGKAWDGWKRLENADAPVV